MLNRYIDKIKKQDIPNIEDYESVLNESIKSLKSRNGYTSGNKQVVDSIKKELEKDCIDVLMFVDNGTGMNQDKLENLLDEISNHVDENAGGSYGVGHLSSYFLSSLRYVLYATKYKGNNKIENLFTGSVILAGHENNQALRGSKGRIIVKIPENEANPNFEYSINFPKFIESKMDKLEATGSMVAILGLNEKWNDDAEYAVASNFFHAISYGGLEVTIHQNNDSTVVDNEKLESLLYARKDKTNARNAILSGQNFYQAYKAIQGSKNTVQLENNDKIYIYNINKLDSGSCICLVRNGMLIARHDNMLSRDINNIRKDENFESFMIVIDIDKSDRSELFRLVRNAENTYHNELIDKKETSLNDKEMIKKLFQELSEEIKQYLEEKDRDSFNLSLPLLEIEDKAETQGINTNRPRSQKPKAQVNKQKSEQPTGKINKTNGSKKRQAPVIVSRVLESTNAVRFKDNG